MNVEFKNQNKAKKHGEAHKNAGPKAKKVSKYRGQGK